MCVCIHVGDKWVFILISSSTVSVHPSRVSGALFQSADRCSGRLCLHWVSDWGGGLPLTALHESQGIAQMREYAIDSSCYPFGHHPASETLWRAYKNWSLLVYSCSQTLAQDFSGFVSSVKVKMTEEGTMSTLRSVMKLCTQSASRNNKVTEASNTTVCIMLKGCGI